MSILYLVRHGQASFGQSDYDRLSPLGERQMRLLGEYWWRWEVRLDAVYTGTLFRQRRSAECAAEGYGAERPLPAPVPLAGFNEYDSQSILTGTIPAALSRHPEIAALVRELGGESGRADLVRNKKAFQRLFSRVMELWVEGRLGISGMESWPEFTARVGAALDRMLQEQGSGKTGAVFTSGGPISVVMQRALGTRDPVTLELGWVIANASITEFRYSGNKFSLTAFNATPHLPEPSLITYR